MYQLKLLLGTRSNLITFWNIESIYFPRFRPSLTFNSRFGLHEQIDVTILIRQLQKTYERDSS